MGIRILFFVVVLLIAGSFWIYDYFEKKRKKSPTVDELIKAVNRQIQEIEESNNASSLEAKLEIERCKSELNKLKNIKIKNQ